MGRPSSWMLRKLGEVAQVVTGSTPSRKIMEYYADEGIPWAKIEDLGKGVFTKTSEYISELGAKRVKQVPVGTVLVSCIGTIGKVGIAGTSMATNQQINALIFDKTVVMPKYAYYYMLASAGQLEQMATSSTIPSVSKKSLLEYPISVPTLYEQQYIVHLLSESEYILSQKKQSLQLLEGYVHRLFSYMFSTNTAKSDRKVLKEFIGDMPMNGIYKSEGYYGSGKPIIRIQNIQDEIIKDIQGLRKVKLEETEINKYLLDSGDILVNRVNSIQNLGKCALIKDPVDGMVFESNMVRIKVDSKKIQPEFLFVWLTTEHVKLYIKSVAKASVNQASINQQDIMNIPVINASLEQQAEFIRLFEEYHVIKEILKSSTEKVQTFFDTALECAIDGRLSAAWRKNTGIYTTEVTSENEVSENTTFEDGGGGNKRITYNSNMNYLVIGGTEFFTANGKKSSPIEVTRKVLKRLKVNDLPKGIEIKLLKKLCTTVNKEYGNLDYLVFGREKDGEYYICEYRAYLHSEDILNDKKSTSQHTIDSILSEKGDFKYVVDKYPLSLHDNKKILDIFTNTEKYVSTKSDDLYSRFQRIPYSEKMFITRLSEFQQVLFEEFLLALSPLAIHIALKRAKKRCEKDEFKNYSIQDAVSSVQLFEKFGLLEQLPPRKIYYFSDEENGERREITDNNDIPVTIDLWQCTFDDGEGEIE